MSVTDRLHAFDRFQQRHTWLAVTIGVFKKRSDDQAGQLAALIAYYGFFSLFPLLLLFVTVLGFVLHDNPSEQQKVLHSTLAQFPILGDQIQHNVHSLRGSVTALAVGIAGAMFAGLGVTLAAQNAFDRVWAVPHRERPNFLKARLRGLVSLILLGAANLASTVIAGLLGGGGSKSVAATIGAIALSLLLNFCLFLGGFRFLTVRDVTTRDLLPGVVLATLFWELLQGIGGYYVNHVLRHASEIYGLFSLVIGLLSFLALGAQLILIAAEVNTVLTKRLWPRSLFNPPLTPGDKQALSDAARTEERVDPERIEVRFDEPSDEPNSH